MAPSPELLRKLAEAIRQHGEEEARLREKRSANIIRAAAGLTLLREKVRAR